MLKVESVTKIFRARNDSGRPYDLKALSEVDLTAGKGEILGLAGASGSGKTTLARVILGLTGPTSGEVFFEGMPVTKMKRNQLRGYRRRVQIIWQNPDSAIDPRFTVARTIMEPLMVHRLGDRLSRLARLEELLDLVDLPADLKERLPHQISSGQRQRVVIARALALAPDLIICDEPLSMVDAVLRVRLAELLLALRQKLGLTYIFISHDMSLLRRVSDRVTVMSEGRIVETSSAENFFNSPSHKASRRLLVSPDATPPAAAVKSKPRRMP